MEIKDSYTVLQEHTISVARNYPRFLALLKAIANRYDNLLSVINYMSECLNIDAAEGVWLDYIGWLVGITREYPDISEFFCVNVDDVNREKYFWFNEQSVNPGSTLSDELFRRRIYGKIGYNTSRCTRNENIRIIKNITLAEHVIIENIEPMVLNITLYGDNIIRISNMIPYIEQVLGNGVGINRLIIRGLDEYGN